MSPRPAVVACVAAVAALSLAGCGSSEEPRAAEPTPVSKDVAECREQWRDLGETVADRAEGDTPSDLASRWTSLVATIDYYATSAKESDCDDRLVDQRKSITTLDAFAASLRRSWIWRAQRGGSARGKPWCRPRNANERASTKSTGSRMCCSAVPNASPGCWLLNDSSRRTRPTSCALR